MKTELVPRLMECSEWHKREAKRHQEHRKMMERCSLGPPYPKKYENQHAMFAKACLDAASNP
jgi:hypothetical protein